MAALIDAEAVAPASTGDRLGGDPQGLRKDGRPEIRVPAGSHIVQVGFDVEADELAIVTAIHRKKGRQPTTIVFDGGSSVRYAGGPGS